MNRPLNHYEETTVIHATPEKIFSYADDHTNFSSHMNKPSWMMGGGSMEIQLDDEKGQKVGSHIRMNGKVFGINLFLDEVVTQHEPPYRKSWQTVGDLNLLVIDHYKLGFEIKPASPSLDSRRGGQRGEPENTNSKFRVYIDYDIPNSAKTRWLGILFGEMYAKWCVNQMISGVKEHLNNFMNIKTKATLTCPKCNTKQQAEMPMNACQHFYKCVSCGELLNPKEGDCCVFCSYADSQCPPKQEEKFKIKQL